MAEAKEKQKQNEKEPPQPRERVKFDGTFTPAWVAKLEPVATEVQYAEWLKRGLSLMLYMSPAPRGTKSWRALFYVGGKPHSRRLGTFPQLSLAKARKKAFEFDPQAAIASAEGGTFGKVAADWLREYVDEEGLRSAGEVKRQLNIYVLPQWGTRPIHDIRRRDVNELLDLIKNKKIKNQKSKKYLGSRSQADAVLATIRGIMMWQMTRDDDYTSPIVPRMNLKRDKRSAKKKSRDRILDDGEIRSVWQACDELDTYGALLKVLLLTGQRLRKVSTMRWTDVTDGVWTISSEPREKGHAGKIKLPELALDIIDAQPRMAGNPFVFAGSAQGRLRKRADDKVLGPPAFNSFSQRKRELDETLPKDMEDWVVHDLRRTARSLLSRLAISPDTAERLLGHAIPGIRDVYDRYKYFEEKSDALKKLADLIAMIINPPEATNVVPLRAQVEVAAH